ncbi:hypothetical protein HY3_16855 [Hyphomonas pacifica]|uniref:Uncharacterized protein n=1 Tax=Hyphomonas pacifica TaxID=1280941 RepID=A0A062TVV1_9PROT|nr:hypothetical protein HY2_16480 [Hyphomonas pacifica]RAN31388.1 hypothetical protein HY3_16855 [Hyphomonas pacifica]
MGDSAEAILARKYLALCPSESDLWELAVFTKNITYKEYIVDTFDVSDFGFDD